ADHFDARHRLDDQLGEVRLALSRGAEAGALVQCVLDGPHDPWMAVAQDERAPRADIIEIGIAVEIVEVSALAASDEDRLAPDAAEGPGRTVHPTGDDTAGLLERLVTPRTVRLHGPCLLGATSSGGSFPRLDFRIFLPSSIIGPFSTAGFLTSI